MEEDDDVNLRGFPVVLVNGPPRSGKDTAGMAITYWIHGGAVLKFAEVLKHAAHALHGLPSTTPHNAFEAHKDEPHSLFLGRTPRQVYIAMSEAMVKPTWGPDFFGQVLVRRLMKCRQAGARFITVTDSGFAEETLPIIAKVGPASVLLIRLHRNGCDFANDSRGYLDLPGVQTLDLVNRDGELSAFEADVVAEVRDWLARASREAA